MIQPRITYLGCCRFRVNVDGDWSGDKPYLEMSVARLTGVRSKLTKAGWTDEELDEWRPVRDLLALDRIAHGFYSYAGSAHPYEEGELGRYALSIAWRSAKAENCPVLQEMLAWFSPTMIKHLNRWAQREGERLAEERLQALRAEIYEEIGDAILLHRKGLQKINWGAIVRKYVARASH